MQAEHSKAPPALLYPLITTCHGWTSSWGSYLLRKQARADATAVMNLQMRSMETQQCWKFQKDTIQAVNKHLFVLPFPPPQVLTMPLAAWFRAELPVWCSLSWAIAQLHIEPVSTAWWLPHAFLHQAASADCISAQCKWNKLTSIWWRFTVCTQAPTQNSSNAVNPTPQTAGSSNLLQWPNPISCTTSWTKPEQRETPCSWHFRQTPQGLGIFRPWTWACGGADQAQHI